MAAAVRGAEASAVQNSQSNGGHVLIDGSVHDVGDSELDEPRVEGGSISKETRSVEEDQETEDGQREADTQKTAADQQF